MAACCATERERSSSAARAEVVADKDFKPIGSDSLCEPRLELSPFLGVLGADGFADALSFDGISFEGFEVVLGVDGLIEVIIMARESCKHENRRALNSTLSSSLRQYAQKAKVSGMYKEALISFYMYFSIRYI